MRIVLSLLSTLLLTVLASAAEEEPVDILSNELGNPEGMVDRLVFFDTAQSWLAGETDRVGVLAEDSPWLVLADPRDSYPRRGTWESPEMIADFPFTEMIPSWNARTPESTGVMIEARVRDVATGKWSPWLYFGQWGTTPTSPYRKVRFDGGAVRVDVLRLAAPADAFQTRVRLYAFNFEPTVVPSLRRVAVSYSGLVEDEKERAALAEAEPPQGEWARDLGVSFITQQDGPEGIKGSICSPTSVTMVTSFWGAARPLTENAAAIYDPDYGIFGNWSRATQRAGELGLDAWVTRMRTWNQVKAAIASGTPVIASIRFTPEEMPSAVFKQSNGHLIVIRGFTPEGDVIVNDPASRERGDGAIYPAEELARAWFAKGGVAYIIKPAS
ncbi:MAG: hypothetical protein PWP23_368 [Candidatus Sumerlaeota bacterium]|nr:hypothetical protein [Candidatus Sumerlaeota bacterium]